MSARMSWRNSATTSAVEGSIAEAASSTHIGALQVAGEGQQLAQQHARVEIGRRLAHRRLRRRQRIVELAGAEQSGCRLVSAAHGTPTRAAIALIDR